MKKIIIGALVLLSPVMVFAADTLDTTGLTGTLASLTGIVNSAIPFLLAIAVVVFIYGVIKFIFGQSSEDKSVAKSYIIWGIVGIAVILAVFGLAKLLLGTFGVETGGTVTPPQIPVGAAADDTD